MTDLTPECAGQLSLAPFVRTSDTSREAAVSQYHKAPSDRARVLAFLHERGAATDEEIAEALGMAPNTARPRRVELVRSGLIGDCGKARTRSGRWATLWGPDHQREQAS